MSGDAHGGHAEEEQQDDGGKPAPKTALPAKPELEPQYLLLSRSFYEPDQRIRLRKVAKGHSVALVGHTPVGQWTGRTAGAPPAPSYGRPADNSLVLAHALEEMVNNPRHAGLKKDLSALMGRKSEGMSYKWHGNTDEFFKRLKSQALLAETEGFDPTNSWHQMLSLVFKHNAALNPAAPHPPSGPAADPGANTPGSQKPGKAPGSQKGQRPAFPGGLPYGAMPGPYGFPPHFDPSMPYGMPHPSSLGPHAGPSMFPGMNPDYFSPYGSASGNPSAAHNPFAGPAHPYGAARLPEHFDPGQVGFFPGVPGMPIAHAGAGAFASGVSPHYAWFSPHLTHLPPEHWAQLGLHQFMPGSMPPLQPYGPTHQIHFNPATGWSMAAPVSEPQTAHSAELMRVLSHRDVFKSKEARASIGRELDALKQEGHLPGLNPFGFGEKHLGGNFEEALRKNEAPLVDVIRTLAHPAMPAGVAEHLHAALLRGILHHAGMDSKRANYVASEFNQLAVEKHLRFKEGGLKQAYDAIHSLGEINAVHERMMHGGQGNAEEFHDAIHSIRPTSAAIPGASHHEVHSRFIGLARRMYR